MAYKLIVTEHADDFINWRIIKQKSNNKERQSLLPLLIYILLFLIIKYIAVRILDGDVICC